MAMVPHDPRLCGLLRFVSAAVVMTCVASVYQDRIVNSLLPLFRTWLDFIDDTYRTVDLSVVTARGESVVRRLVTAGHIHIVAGAMVYPDSSRLLSSEAATGIVLQPLILAIALLIAWPWQRARELALRFAAAALLMPAVMLLDVPMMLYGFAWFDEIKELDPNRFSLVVTWADAMNAGGRFALTVAAVVLSVAAGSAISPRLFRTRRASNPAEGRPPSSRVACASLASDPPS
jgi:hypothetical protein